MSAQAATVYYSVADEKAFDKVAGTGRTETYDVAIKVTDPTLVGSKVVGVRVPMATTEKIVAPRAFVTTELKLDKVDGKKQNVADWEYVDGSFDGGYLVAKFTKPYELTADGVYVGFSFTIDELTEVNMNPLLGKRQVDNNGCWIHTTRSYLSWSNESKNFNFTSSMQVELEGAFSNVGGGLTISEDVFVQMNEGFKVPVIYHNFGGEPIKTIEYSYSMGDVTGTGTKTFDRALSVQFGCDYSFDLDIEKGIDAGVYELAITIDKVNGEENTIPTRTATCNLEVFKRKPVHRPLVEEYTGMWCGYCPRGFATMDYMKRIYGDDFVGLAYHCHAYSGDYIAVMPSSSFPSPVSGYPKAYIERVDVMDPYHGRKEADDDPSSVINGFNFEKFWTRYREEFTPAAIEVYAWWNEEDKSKIDCRSVVTFCREMPNSYKVEFILAHDGMQENVQEGKDPTWLQQNNYVNSFNYLEIEEMEQFVNGQFMMGNLVYNDVVLGTSRLYEFDDNLAGKSVNVDYNSYFTFDTSKCTSLLDKKNLVQDKNKLRVVAVVIDKVNGRVLNSAQCAVSSENGVETIESVPADVVSIDYYDLAGRRVADTTEGIVIKVVRFSDGTSLTSKLYNK